MHLEVTARRNIGILNSWLNEIARNRCAPRKFELDGMVATSTLQEVLLVVHFPAPLQVSILDMADWANEFSEYPTAQQLPFVPRVELAGPGPMGISLSVADAGVPRLLLRSKKGERTVQLQNDRFAFGWSRTIPVGEGAEYPGYESLKVEWLAEFHKFNAWCSKRMGVVPKAKLVELGYNNASPIVVGGQRRRLSDIFQWVRPARPVNAFQVSWMELLETDRIDAARVAAVAAVGAAPPVLEALIYNFTGFAPIDNDDERTISDAFDMLHRRILEMYDSAIRGNGGTSK